MFEDFAALQPLKEAAEILAKKTDWPMLYNLGALGANTVPTAGATYYEDMYVDFELAQVRLACFITKTLSVHLIRSTCEHLALTGGASWTCFWAAMAPQPMQYTAETCTRGCGMLAFALQMGHWQEFGHLTFDPRATEDDC